MRSFLFALICLSILLGAQNVLAISPVSDSVIAPTATLLSPAPGVAPLRGATHEPSTMGLMLAGLAGLTAAGGRARRLSDDRVSLRNPA